VGRFDSEAKEDHDDVDGESSSEEEISQNEGNTPRTYCRQICYRIEALLEEEDNSCKDSVEIATSQYGRMATTR